MARDRLTAVQRAEARLCQGMADSGKALDRVNEAMDEVARRLRNLVFLRYRLSLAIASAAELKPKRRRP